MKTIAVSTLLAGALATTIALAARPADAPAGTTGLCKDGTYSSSAEKKGACHGHKGVKEWFESAAAPSTPTKEITPAKSVAPAPAVAPIAPVQRPTTVATAAPATPVAGGGAGQVWVNESTKVYHCRGDKWYGKTKQGQYMSEAEAKTKGFHGDHGKTCS